MTAAQVWCFRKLYIPERRLFYRMPPQEVRLLLRRNKKGKIVPYLLYSEPVDYKQHKRIAEYHNKLDSFVTAGNQCEAEIQFVTMVKIQI